MNLHHLGWVGRDIARMRQAFEREGGTPVGEPIADPLQRVTVQFLREPGSGELWELIAPLGPPEDSPLAARLRRGGGLDHVCYALEEADGSLEERLAAEVANGSRVICEPVMAKTFGCRIAFVRRASGRVVEFIEAASPDIALF